MQLSRASSSLGGSRSSVAPRPQRSPVGPVVPSVASRRGLAGLAVHQREASRLVPCSTGIDLSAGVCLAPCVTPMMVHVSQAGLAFILCR